MKEEIKEISKEIQTLIEARKYTAAHMYTLNINPRKIDKYTEMMMEEIRNLVMKLDSMLVE